MKHLVVIIVLSLTLACGPKLPPDVSVEGKTAVRATQVIAALRATLPALKAATCQPGVPVPCLAPADTDKVVGHIQTAAKGAQELAVVLQAVDDAQTAALQAEGMTKARALLVSIQASLTQATVAPGLEGARQQVVLILSTVTSLLFVVSAF